MSWSTKASRSAGSKVSRTTSRARPTESAKSVSSSGEVASTGPRRVRRVQFLPGPGAQHVQADPSHHGGQPATEVVHGSASDRFSRSQASWTASSAS